MSDFVKGAMIVAVAIIIATSLWIYFSPYQSCVRAIADNDPGKPFAHAYCATN